MNKRFLWRDNKEGITFIKSSIIIDTKKSAQVIPYLDQYEKESRKPPYVDLLVHEQYFYDYYHNYQPDYCAKVMMAVKWAKDNGYTPAFISECIRK
jgi:superoxide dismutase